MFLKAQASRLYIFAISSIWGPVLFGESHHLPGVEGVFSHSCVLKSVLSPGSFTENGKYRTVFQNGEQLL